MRKIFLFMMVSVDGYFEGPDHDISWHNVDSEFQDFALDQLNEVDALIFGRRTYELMSSFWPTKTAIKADPQTAKAMNDLDKLVVSSSLASTDWNNTTLISSTKPLKQLKAKSGKSIAVFGSSNLCLTLLKENLLDEIRLMVNPVVLGRGKPLFAGLDRTLKLELIKSRQFRSSNVLNVYRVLAQA